MVLFLVRMRMRKLALWPRAQLRTTMLNRCFHLLVVTTSLPQCCNYVVSALERSQLQKNGRISEVRCFAREAGAAPIRIVPVPVVVGAPCVPSWEYSILGCVEHWNAEGFCLKGRFPDGKIKCCPMAIRRLKQHKLVAFSKVSRLVAAPAAQVDLSKHQVVFVIVTLGANAQGQRHGGGCVGNR
jgi:hypothetical protein